MLPQSVKREARKSQRRLFRHPAMILNSDKSIFGQCTMLDVSANGAKIKLQVGDQVPDEFILLLSKGGKVSRQCKVSWRRETEIGVQFVVGSSKDKI
jgi:PilZ domain